MRFRRRQAAGQAERQSLDTWRQRRALPLLVAVPAVALAVLATGRVMSSAHDLAAYQRVHYLAETGEGVAGLAQALEVERTQTATFVVLGPLNGGRGTTRPSATYLLEKRVLQGAYRATDRRAQQVMRQVGAIGGSYPAPVRAHAREEITAIKALPSLRRAATATQLNGLSVTGEYTSVIQDVLGFTEGPALPGGDPGLVRTVRALSLVSRIKEEESSQAAILTSGLSSDLVGQGSFGASSLAAITSSMARQRTYGQEFAAEATAAQVQQYDSVLSEAPVERASAEEQVAVTTASDPGASAGPTIADASTGLGYQFSGLRAMEIKLSSSAAAQAASRHGAAEASAAVFGALLLILVLLVAAVFLLPRLPQRRDPGLRSPE